MGRSMATGFGREFGKVFGGCFATFIITLFFCGGGLLLVAWGWNSVNDKAIKLEKDRKSIEKPSRDPELTKDRKPESVEVKPVDPKTIVGSDAWVADQMAKAESLGKMATSLEKEIADREARYKRIKESGGIFGGGEEKINQLRKQLAEAIEEERAIKNAINSASRAPAPPPKK